MSDRGDDLGMTRRRDLDDRSADALLSGRAVDGEPELAALLGTMHRLADVPAPAPSEALAAMLAAGLPAEQLAAVPAVSFRSTAVSWRAVSWRSARALTRVSVAGTAALGLVLSAAAANALPAPAQTAVAEVVGAVTPLHLPRPADRTPAPAVTPTSTPTPPVAAPTTAPTPRSVPAPLATPHRDGQDDGARDGEDGRTPAPSAPDRERDSGTHEGDHGDGVEQAPRTGSSPTPEPRETEDSSGSGSGDGGGTGSELSGSSTGETPDSSGP